MPDTHSWLSLRSEGGAGAVKLAEAVVAASAQPSQFKFLYDLDHPIADKIETIVKEVRLEVTMVR